MALKMEKSERQKWLQVRMSDEELETLRALADAYGQDMSDFVRSMVRWMDEQRPVMRITPKDVALA